MFAAIYIPDFPVEAIVRLKPELRERAVAVMEGTAPLVRIAAVNERAADAGIEPGMTKLQAEERAAACNGVLIMRSAEQEQSARAALIDVACSFSPRVEDTAAGLAVIDLAGLERIFGPAPKIARDLARRCTDIGLEAQVAIAANPDTAVHAARGFSGVTVIPEGREAERLATLPLEVLAEADPRNAPQRAQRSSKRHFSVPSVSAGVSSPGLDLLNTLESWGVRNLRALAALPEVAVSERLGQCGIQWQRMARGATRRALTLIEPPLRFEETCELDDPVESLEPLSFLLNRMLEQLCARLESRALATNEIRLTLTLDPAEDIQIEEGERGGAKNLKIENLKISDFQSPVSPRLREEDVLFTRTLRLPVPMLNAKVFLKLLQLDLQSNPPGAPVEKITIAAQPAEPRRTQEGLFLPNAPEAERLEVTLARIQSSVAGQSPADVNRELPNDNQKCGSEVRVGSAEILDTHRPDAFRMNRFVAAGPRFDQKSEIENQKCVTALRLFRPPLPAQVTARNGKPVSLSCEPVHGDILWAAGPWKSSGEWWNEQPWAREEWDVCVGAACYRIYREQKGWFIEGSYD